MIRTAVLIDERDRRIGRTTVPEADFILRHGDAVFVRTSESVRMNRAGPGGTPVVFRQTEVYVRQQLEPV